MEMDEQIHAAPLSIGSILGGTSRSTRQWDESTSLLSRWVAGTRAGVASPLNVNVVFLVPGEVIEPDFEGVRTGRFSGEDSWLLVQVALPEEPPEDVDGYLRDALIAAIDEAEQWARKRKLAEDLRPLRRLVEAL